MLMVGLQLHNIIGSCPVGVANFVCGTLLLDAYEALDWAFFTPKQRSRATTWLNIELDPVSVRPK